MKARKSIVKARKSIERDQFLNEDSKNSQDSQYDCYAYSSEGE